jgi:hypothetical protein
MGGRPEGRCPLPAESVGSLVQESALTVRPPCAPGKLCSHLCRVLREARPSYAVTRIAYWSVDGKFCSE